jgi:hypothetical protein
MKSIWKSKSFLAGLVSVVTAISAGYGIPIPPGVIEGIFGVIGTILIGKSVTKRMVKNGTT